MTIPTTPPPADEAWLPWEGGECPVAPETYVEVKLRNGRGSANLQARNWTWTWAFKNDEHPGDIIAYRIVSPSPPPAITSAVAANDGSGTFVQGIVYAAGWLCSAHGHDSLAEELLATANLETADECRAVGAEDHDIEACGPVFATIRARGQAEGE